MELYLYCPCKHVVQILGIFQHRPHCGLDTLDFPCNPKVLAWPALPLGSAVVDFYVRFLSHGPCHALFSLSSYQCTCLSSVLEYGFPIMSSTSSSCCCMDPILCCGIGTACSICSLESPFFLWYTSVLVGCCRFHALLVWWPYALS